VPTATANATTTGTVSSSPSATLVPVPENDTSVSEWAAHGCAIDSGDHRILSGWSDIFMKQLTTDQCLSTCEDQGYKFAGTEYGEQCFCGNEIPDQIHFDDAQCTIQCAGSSNATEKCGGFWAMNLYELVSSGECPVDNGTTTGVPSATATSATTRIGDNNVGIPTLTAPILSLTTIIPTLVPTTASPSPSTTTATRATVSPSPSPVPTSSTGNPPSTSGENSVWAHHMVGNTYPYGVSDWLIDIQGAAAVGIDGFALNMGVESWQVDRVADAYTAAQQSGLDFKLFLSLDMTSLGCWSASDASNLVGLVSRWANHPNAAMHNGKVLVSTFAGSDCHFGQGVGSKAWQNMFVDALGNKGVDIFFVPSIFSDISTFSSNTWMDGEVSGN
jgi:glucan endo-1,3-alpha-glucosidase